ncbi:hypothetical protein [Nannocystis pusilla]|uniref:hypothetical protein n=1 Tax=Nannocystis pusilla TaxID=889268 RepID=UPI003B76224E
MAASSSHTAYPSEVYESFDAFMQQVIKDTYERGAKRPEFVALVLASGELLPMAWGKMKKSGIRELAVGVGGVVALRYGLAYIVSGPIGVALTGFTVAAMVSFFWQNQKKSWPAASPTSSSSTTPARSTRTSRPATTTGSTTRASAR